MNDALPLIESFERRPAPTAAPIGIAWDGTRLWIGSVETDRIYAIDPYADDTIATWEIPGTPYGMVMHEGRLHVVVGDPDSDDRSIAQLDVNSGLAQQKWPCPDATGSWLASDGERLYLSQRFEHRIFEFDSAGTIRRTIGVQREITGMTFADGALYLMTTHSKEVDDYRLVRLDLRDGASDEKQLAALPPAPRGLAHDGARFWTNLRDRNETISFTLV